MDIQGVPIAFAASAQEPVRPALIYVENEENVIFISDGPEFEISDSLVLSYTDSNAVRLMQKTETCFLVFQNAKACADFVEAVCRAGTVSFQAGSQSDFDLSSEAPVPSAPPMFFEPSMRKSKAVVECDVLEWDPLEALLPAEVDVASLSASDVVLSKLRGVTAQCQAGPGFNMAAYKEASKSFSKSWSKYARGEHGSEAEEQRKDEAYHGLEDAIKAAAGDPGELGAVREKASVLTKLLGGREGAGAAAAAGEGREEMRQRMRESLMVSVKRGHMQRAVLVFPFTPLFKGDVVGVVQQGPEWSAVESAQGQRVNVPSAYLQMLPSDLMPGDDGMRMSTRAPLKVPEVSGKDGKEFVEACIEVLQLLPEYRQENDEEKIETCLSAVSNEALLLTRGPDAELKLQQMLDAIDALSQEILIVDPRPCSIPHVAEELKKIIGGAILVMGGQPMKNYDKLLKSLDLAAAKYAFGPVCCGTIQIGQLREYLVELSTWANDGRGQPPFGPVAQSCTSLLKSVPIGEKVAVQKILAQLSIALAKLEAGQSANSNELLALSFKLYTETVEAVERSEKGVDATSRDRPAVRKHLGSAAVATAPPASTLSAGVLGMPEKAPPPAYQSMPVMPMAPPAYSNVMAERSRQPAAEAEIGLLSFLETLAGEAPPSPSVDSRSEIGMLAFLNEEPPADSRSEIGMLAFLSEEPPMIASGTMFNPDTWPGPFESLARFGEHEMLVPAGLFPALVNFCPPSIRLRDPLELLNYGVGPRACYGLLHGFLISDPAVDPNKPKKKWYRKKAPEVHGVIRNIGKGQEFHIPVTQMPLNIQIEGSTAVVEALDRIVVPGDRIAFHMTPCTRFPSTTQSILPTVRIAMPRDRFYPGETMHGVVVLTLTTRSSIRSLRLAAKGVHRIDSFYTYSCGSHTCTAYVDETHDIFLHELDLAGMPRMLAPGQYAFEFSFFIPIAVPCSSNVKLWGTGSAISYTVSAFASIDNGGMEEAQRDFFLAAPLPPMTLDNSICVSSDLRFLLSRNKDACTISLQLRSRAPVSPGGAVPVRLIVDNRSSKTIKKVHIGIWIKLKVCAEGHSQLSFLTLGNRDLNLELEPGTVYDGDLRIVIPKEYDFYCYDFDTLRLGQAKIKAYVRASIAFGMKSTSVKRRIQIVPDLQYLAHTPPPLVPLRPPNAPALHASMVNAADIPWYIHM